MRESYDPADPTVDFVSEDVVRDSDKVAPFTIGQSYEDVPAKPIECARCGETRFEVAEGSFFTAIRCVQCRWEACIHDG